MNGKMFIPLRGTQCTHIDTVDLDRFIVENFYRYKHFWKHTNSFKWICPICKQKMPLNTIRISKQVQDKIEYCEKNEIKNYFITYDLYNRKFHYYVINENAQQRNHDNYCSKVILEPFNDKKNQLDQCLRKIAVYFSIQQRVVWILLK